MTESWVALYAMDAEQRRLNAAREVGTPWKKWGPYLSERQWGTLREDYSQDGNAWAYFSHDQSRSRAYRWGEDGIADAGLGASHQTGWTGMVARLMDMFARMRPELVLASTPSTYLAELTRQQVAGGAQT
jgi:hypothetical protein